MAYTTVGAIFYAQTYAVPRAQVASRYNPPATLSP